MALTHVTAIRNQLADLVVDAIDAGAGAGDLQIAVDSGFTQVASTITFADPAFGAASGGTASALGVPIEDDPAAGQGSAVTVWRTRDSDSNEVFRGTATGTGGGGDMELSSTTIAAGDAVRLNSFDYSASA